MTLPAWVYDLITAVELYEDVHGPHDENWPCLGKTLDAVPERERDCARAIVAWRQESGWLPPDAQVASAPDAKRPGCPCGCPVVGDMCSCPEPCPCEPNCVFCNAPMDGSAT